MLRTKSFPLPCGRGWSTPAAASCLRAHARLCVRFAARWCAVRCLTAPLIPRQSAYALEHTCSFHVKLLSIQWFIRVRYAGGSAAEASCTTPYYAMYAREHTPPERSIPAFPRSSGHRLALDTPPGAGQAACVTVPPTPGDRRTPPGAELSAQATPVREGIRADRTPRALSFAVDKCSGAVVTAGRPERKDEVSGRLGAGSVRSRSDACPDLPSLTAGRALAMRARHYMPRSRSTDFGRGSIDFSAAESRPRPRPRPRECPRLRSLLPDSRPPRWRPTPGSGKFPLRSRPDS